MATVYGSNSGVYQGRRRTFTPENGTQLEKEWRGPANKIAELFDSTVASPDAPTRFELLESEEINGRGRIVARYAGVGPIGVGGDMPARDDTVEELYAVDVIKDIRQHPDFQTGGDHTLSTDDMRRVNAEIEKVNGSEDDDWTDAMKRLYRMLVHGLDSYIETAFVLRHTVYGARKKAVRMSFENVNKVVPAPQLSAAMNDVIESLPAGQWLKKPPTAEYLGRGKWRVSMEYQWSEKWHKVYSGPVDGLLDWGP